MAFLGLNPSDFIPGAPAIHDVVAGAGKLSDLGGKDTHTTLSALMQQGGFTGEDARIAVAVALAESGGRANATNHNTDGTQDTGLMQINDVHHGSETVTAFRNRMLDPVENVKEGKSVFASSGWNAWTTYKNGTYRKFMGRDASITLKKNTVFDTAGSVASAVTQPISVIGDLAGALLNPSTYLRVGKGVLGGVLVILGTAGIVFVIGKSANGTPIVKAATKVVK